MRNCLLLVLIFFSVNLGFSQLSKNHYFPPLAFAQYNGNSAVPNQDYLVITTPSATPVNVTVYEAGVPTNYTVSNAMPLELNYINAPCCPGGSYSSPMLLQIDGTATTNADFGVPKTDKGIWIEAESEVYAYYKLNGGNSFAQAEMVVSKGTAAKGTQFFTGHLYNTQVNGDRGNFVSVMSLTDNNVITLSGLDPATHVINLGTGAAHTVTLNKNEVVVFAASTNDPNSTDAIADGAAFIGAQINSTGNVVVNTGSANGNMTVNSDTGRDYAIDQIVPLELVGTEYVLVQGNGIDDHERAIIVATEPNTTIYFNNNATSVVLANVGDYYISSSQIDPTNWYDGNGNMAIESDKPVYVYQAGMGDTNINTQNMFFVPPISCSAPKSIDFIKDIEIIGDITYTGSLNVHSQTGAVVQITAMGSTFTLGAGGYPAGVSVTGPTAVNHQPGTLQTYEVYKVAGLTGDVAINSDYDLYTGLFGYNGNAGFGGFFSGFDVIPEVVTDPLGDLCSPSTLIGTTGFDTYQWYLDGAAIAGATSSDYEATEGGEYHLEAGVTGCPTSLSDTIEIFESEFITAGPDIEDCQSDTIQITGSSSEPGVTFLWVTNGDGDFEDRTDNNTGYIVGPYDISIDSVMLILTGDNNGCADSDTTIIYFTGGVIVPACQDVSVTLDATGGASITASDVNNGSSGGCGTLSYALDQTFFECDDIGDVTVTLTVTDEDMNSATCTATVTVSDDEDPVITCQPDISLTEADCPLTLVIGASATDNCDIVITADSTAFSSNYNTCIEEIGGSIIYTATDLAGNTASCTQNITITDNTPPVITPIADITVNQDPSTCEAIANYTVDVSDCSTWTWTSSIASGSSFPLGTTTVVINAEDGCGNTSSTSFDVTVVDVTAPVATCFPGTTIEACSGVPIPETVAISDACLIENGTILSTTYSYTSTTGSCPNNIVWTQTATVTDEAGNSDSCTRIITVSDTEAPVITVPADMTVDTDPVTCEPAVDFTYSATDCSTVTSLTADYTSGDQFPIGTTTVTVTATDECGNTSNASFNITVEDNTPPTTVCNDLTISLDDNGEASIDETDIDGGSTDACGIASISIDGADEDWDCTEVGSHTVTLTVEDNNGNVSTCDATLTVEDATPPTAICNDLSVELDANGEFVLTTALTDGGSTDNCGIASLVLDADDVDWDCNEVGMHVYTMTVTDVNGNVSTCNGDLTIDDNTGPTAVCNDLTVSVNSAGFYQLDPEVVGAGSGDNCGESPLTYSLDEEIMLCEDAGSVVTVTLTVTDAAGNSSTCEAEITVEDNIPPTVLECMHDLTLTTDPGLCTANSPFEDWTYIYTDNCLAEGITVTDDNPYNYDFPVGTTTVTLTFTDNAGNAATCSFDITVTDDEAPDAVCQDITVQLDDTGNATITAADIDGGSTDNCGIASLEIAADDQDWTCAEVGDNTVTLTVTDVNGNVSTCDATVTVEDNVPPVAVCQDITIQLDADGNATITAADIDGGSTDACGIASVEIDAADENWTCADVGDNTVTLTVTDVNGNVSTCDATVTVEDNIAPDAVCQDITIQLDADGNASITAADIDGGSTDACGIASIEIDAADEDWTCAEVGDNTVTLTVTDVNGNSSTCDATVTVEDNVAPDAVCQDITIELDENGEASIVAADIDGGSTDACGIASIEIDADDEDWTCAEVGDNTVTLTVTDVNGNSSTCDATVTVEDNIAPSLVCPDIEINLDPGLCGAVVDYDIESTDNCGVASEVTVAGPASGDYLDYHDGPWTVTMDVTDVNGNVSSCDFTITMNEFANPTETLACNDHVYIALDEDGCSTVGADMILEGGPYGCYDDYIVTVENGTAEVCCDEIGQILTVVVTDPDTGNTCEGTIEAFDNLAPTCVSIADYTIACEAELPSGDDTGHPGYPVFEDNCGLDLVYLSVETILDGDICTDPGMQIERVWYAVDESGNVVADADACVQTITIERTPLTFPGDQTYDCASYELADLVPALTGEPTPASAAACMYNATYSDQVLPTCGGLSKVIRTWTVMDWCTGEVITTDGNGGTNVQELKLMDGEGPSIDGTDIVVGTDTDQCGFTGFIPALSITDNCTGVASVQMFITGLPALELVYDAAGNVVGGLVGEPGLSLGSDEVLIVATDNCGNFTEETVTITVEDQTEPLPICDEITQVALTTDGTAEVFAETFDDGSYDNCCLDGFDVTRMDDGTFGPSVLFDCADVNTSVQVIFRAHDCHGNSNVCMVEVLVEDKINPYLGVPANTEISCDVYYADLAAELDAGNGAILETMFGEATSGDNCEAIVDYSYTYSVDECGVGSITRSWTVTDPSGNGPVSGTQTIVIYHVSDWTISFPGDIMADCVDGQLPDFGEPTVTGDNCENIAISYTDTQYDVVPDACFKIVREWTAINWCTYPDETAQTAVQVMKVVDTEAPIFDVEDMTVEITESDCDTPVTLPTPDVTDCSDDITITTTSDLPAGEAGPGTYTASYVVTDGCGNVSYDQITITVVDAKKPTPYLTDELVTEIMQTGMTLTVEAEDFDIGSFDNCSDVTLSFSPDVTDTERVFDCSQLGPNTLEVWVTDAAGNQDFATVTLTVQDNMGVCGPGTLTIAGALTTEGGEGIEDATVEINGGLFNHTTDETGTYSFDLEAGADYSVVPSLDLDAGNGVTTFDMVLITQHILGMNTFTNPYQLIAADANNSNTITTLDLVAIRMVILQMTDAFPNNTSWRFVDADHVFADPTNPWGYPEVINYNNLDAEDLAADFIGVKIGDVNGTAQANFQSPAENRTNKNIQINTTDEQVQAGQEVTVHFTSAAAVSGYQFTLNHEGLELVSIQEGLARTEHFGVHAGALTTSWNDMEIRNLAGEDLFSVTFKATEPVQLSEVLTINSRYTQAEAYTTQGIEGVELTFSGQANTDYVLYQNVPNPFNGQTTIGFDLAKAGPASLTIMTIDGQTVKSITGDFAAGYNEVIIKDLNAVGVLYYSLESGDFTATKKMIVIE